MPGSSAGVRSPRAPGVKIAIVLPAYNEEGNLTPLVTLLRDVADRNSLDLRIIVVDDASTDGPPRS